MFNDVNSQIEQVSAATEEISAGMEQSSASVQEVASMSFTVKEEVNTSAQKAKEGLSIALEIQKKADEINASSSRDILNFIDKDVKNDYENLVNVSIQYKNDGTTVKNIVENFAEISENISTSVDQISKSMDEVATDVSEVAKTSGEIAENVTIVTERTDSICSETKNNSLGAEKLLTSIEKFKID